MGELLLHAICRDYFGTIPVAPRVFYLTSSNDVVKSFDLVHVRPFDGDFEIWLGEAKFYKKASKAVAAAIESIETHIDAGFLKHEKLVLCPQIDPTAPYSGEISDIFSEQTSLDKLFQKSVFPICIAAESVAARDGSAITSAYKAEIETELEVLRKKFASSTLASKIKMVVIYVPLATKKVLAQKFDKKLKAILAC